jgi:hypothetical protein
MMRFAPGIWSDTRGLNCLVVDFHDNNQPWMPYHEKMADAGNRALEALEQAQRDGRAWVLFTHGQSTSRPGATTCRSVVRSLMRGRQATPFLNRAECRQGEAFFLAAIKPAAPAAN